ncbi:MAG TPA: methyltransferase domain-containing protein [Oscillospiraceae bacterium]|nr:methyltransferase domain-containing protein [Oscillospiraceae bacterium]
MSSYAAFARYYDSLTLNVNYPARADYLCSLFSNLNHNTGITLDLACGTGSLTVELAKRGLDIYGIDGSMSMLSVAQQKAATNDLNILFLCQQMQRIDLYGTVDTVICALDSINHLTSEKDVLSTFQRVSLFLNEDGYFVFDVNTTYKHKQVLSNNTFVYDTDDVYCVWQNSYESKKNRVGISLDFFARDSEVYHRSSEHFYERAYPTEQLISMLNQAGMELVHLYDDMSFSEPNDTSERLVFVTKKIKAKE